MVNHIKYAAVYCVFIDESEPRGANGLAEGAEYTEWDWEYSKLVCLVVNYLCKMIIKVFLFRSYFIAVLIMFEFKSLI